MFNKTKYLFNNLHCGISDMTSLAAFCNSVFDWTMGQNESRISLIKTLRTQSSFAVFHLQALEEVPGLIGLM